jgi:hypothetical protein
MSAAAAVGVLYGGEVADEGIDVWPAAGHALLDELKAARGRVALITAAPADANALVERLRADLGVSVVRLGRAVADRPRPPSDADVELACGNATVITDLDVLLWPEMNIAPLQLLTARARRRPTIAVWPGPIARGRATYSVAGRPDHHDTLLHDVVIMRPRVTRFPDEVPFIIERILL